MLNYEIPSSLPLHHPDGADPAALETEARRYLIDGQWFVAEGVGLPDLRPGDWVDEIDHDWHEVHSFAATEAEPDDPWNRDIAGFLRDLRTKVAVMQP